MTPFRIAVIGAGRIAESQHLPSLRNLAAEDADLDLAALCDVNEERARAMAARFGFRQVYGDYHRMLDAVAPDAVWMLAPYRLARQIAGDLLALGVPTLMEKPPGANAHETRELRDIALANGTPHMVAFNRRRAPFLVRMKELLRERGPVSVASCQFYRNNRTESTFPFGTALHGLDALRFLVEREVVAVDTRLGPRGSALVMMSHDGGAMSLLEMLPQVGVQSERYTAHAGSRTVMVEGVIDWLTEFPGYLRRYDGGKLVEAIENTSGAVPPQAVTGFWAESAHFIQSLREGVAPQPSLAEALRSVEVAEAVQRALDDNVGGKVTFA